MAMHRGALKGAEGRGGRECMRGGGTCSGTECVVWDRLDVECAGKMRLLQMEASVEGGE